MSVQYLVKHSSIIASAFPHFELQHFVVSLLTAKMLILTITNQPYINSMGDPFMSKFHILGRHTELWTS